MPTLVDLCVSLTLQEAQSTARSAIVKLYSSVELGKGVGKHTVQ